MSGFNERHGLRRAGKRDMMKLPEDRALRAIVTSAKCPKCDRRGAKISKVKAGHLFCVHCYEQWPIPESVSNA